MAKQARGARETALITLQKIESDGAYANLALDHALRGASLSAADRAFVTELVYGVVRNRLTLEYILRHFLQGGKRKLPLWIKLILEMGIYQLRFMEKIPDSAAVNESVCLARKFGHQGTAGLVNGVLRNAARKPKMPEMPSIEDDPAEHISVCYSHPKWLAAHWLAKFGLENTLALCRFDNTRPKLCLRVNTLKLSRDEALDRLAALGITARKSIYTAAGIIAEHSGDTLRQLIEEGLFYPQHETSILAGELLLPTPGSRVLDLCAAPGGKTTHLAALMQNRGEIRAFDLHQHRVDLINENARRLGIDIIKAAAADSRHLPELPDGFADYALLDAPCSGLGVLANRPDSRWHKRPEDIAELAELAYELLLEAARKVRVLGYILFSTCTITDEENYDNIKRFLREHREFRLAKFPCLPEGLQKAEIETGILQLLPYRDGLEGFFMARLERLE